MSRYNTLALGEAECAAELLAEDVASPSTEELTAALINALRRIDRLERQVANLRKDLNE